MESKAIEIEINMSMWTDKGANSPGSYEVGHLDDQLPLPFQFL